MEDKQLMDNFGEMMTEDLLMFEKNDLDIEDLDYKYREIMWFIIRNLLSHNVLLDLFCHLLHSDDSLGEYVNEELKHFREEKERSLALAETIESALKDMGLNPSVVISGDSVSVSVSDASKKEVLNALNNLKNSGSK